MVEPDIHKSLSDKTMIRSTVLANVFKVISPPNSGLYKAVVPHAREP
jgi:hypothetical protein